MAPAPSVLLAGVIVASLVAIVSSQGSYWGESCTYTGAVERLSFSVAKNEEKVLFRIPAGRTKVFARFSANADLDTNVRTASGVRLLQYCCSHDFCSSWDCWINFYPYNTYATAYSYNGMNFKFCVDMCVENAVMGPYHDGKSYTISGGPASWATEWTTIDRVSPTGTRGRQSARLFLVAVVTMAVPWWPVVC